MPTERPHGMFQYPGRPVPPGPSWKPARHPATDAAERPESPRPQGGEQTGTPNGSEALSAGFATGGPIPGSRGDDRIPYRLGENGCGLFLQSIPPIVVNIPDPPSGEEIAERMRAALRRPPMVLPYAPEERGPVAKVEMHPDLITALTRRGEVRSDPGAGLLGVPVIPNPTLPLKGWRSYDADGNVIGQWPPPPPEPTGFITTVKPPPRSWLQSLIRRFRAAHPAPAPRRSLDSLEVPPPVATTRTATTPPDFDG